MADIIVNNLPLNVAPVGEDVLLLIKNSDGTLTRVPVGNLSSIFVTEDVFWATYGTSTWADIYNAISAHKVVACRYSNREYFLERRESIGMTSSDVKCTFTASDKDGSVYYLILNGSIGTWSNGNTSAPVTSVDGKTGAVAILPSGGTTGQVLKKSSNTNYAVEWANESGGGGSSPSPYTSNPAALGTASPGSSDNYARGDHVHPLPFIPVAGNSNPEPLGTASPGVSLYYAHADHVHAMPSAANVGAIAAPVSASNGQFLMYNGTAWVASSLPTYNGEVS